MLDSAQHDCPWYDPCKTLHPCAYHFFFLQVDETLLCCAHSEQLPVHLCQVSSSS